MFGTNTATINMDELVLCGHSFGGLTALLTAAKLGPLCKAVCVMDPFLHAYEEECCSGELYIKHCPIQVINSEHFHPHLTIFESW